MLRMLNARAVVKMRNALRRRCNRCKQKLRLTPRLQREHESSSAGQQHYILGSDPAEEILIPKLLSSKYFLWAICTSGLEFCCFSSMVGISFSHTLYPSVSLSRLVNLRYYILQVGTQASRKLSCCRASYMESQPEKIVRLW